MMGVTFCVVRECCFVCGVDLEGCISCLLIVFECGLVGVVRLTNW